MSDYRDPDGTHLNLFSENAAGEDKIVNAPALTGGFTSWQLPPPNRNEASAAHDSMQHQPPPRYNNNNMSNWGSSNSLGAHMPPQRPAHPGTPRASAGSTPPRSLPLDPEEQFELDLDPDADEQELSANDILRMSGLAKRTSAAPAPSVPPTAPSTDDKPTYTRIPLNKDELALKGKLLADLIAERYGPPDYEGEMYNYSRGPAYGARMYKKGGEGDWRFKVQKNGEEHPESATQFDSRMHAVWKAKQQKEVAAAQKLKEKEEEALRKGIQKASADAKKRKLSKAKGSKKDKRTASDGQSEDDDEIDLSTIIVGEVDHLPWTEEELHQLLGYMLNAQNGKQRLHHQKTAWRHVYNDIFKCQRPMTELRGKFEQLRRWWKEVHDRENHTGGGDGEELGVDQTDERSAAKKEKDDKFADSWEYEAFEQVFAKRVDCTKVIDLQSTKNNGTALHDLLSDEDGSNDDRDESGDQRKRQRKNTRAETLREEAQLREDAQIAREERSVNASTSMAGGLNSLVEHVRQSDIKASVREGYQELLTSKDPAIVQKGEEMRAEYMAALMNALKGK